MTSPKDKPDKPDTGPDLARLESDYRAGILTTREIGAKHGMSHVMVLKHAKAGEWQRDLKARIKAKADTIVTQIVANAEAREQAKAQGLPEPVTKSLEVTKTAGNRLTPEEEEVVVTGAAMANAYVRIKHQTVIKRFQTLAVSMLAELEAASANVPELHGLAELLVSPDRNGNDKLNEIYRSIIAMPGRTKTMKDLADVLKTLIGLEREAHGIASVKENEEPPGIQPDISTDPRAAYQWLAGQKPKST